MKNEELLFIITLILFGLMALTENILRKMIWPKLMIGTVKVNPPPFFFLKKSQLDLLTHVLIQATHMYTEVVPKLLTFINLGHVTDVKTLKPYNIVL